MKVIKREGQKEKFAFSKILNAISAAFKSTPGFEDGIPAEFEQKIWKEFNVDNPRTENGKLIPLTVESIQDRILNLLYDNGYRKVYDNYLIYRYLHQVDREYAQSQKAFIENYKKSDNNANATIDDNSNVSSKNIGTLNSEIHKSDNVKTSRWMVMDMLKKLFPDFDHKMYIRDMKHHTTYKHDESSFAGPIAPYCVAGTMYPFLTHGIKKLGGLSAKPCNLDSFCGIFINWIFAMSGQFAGAVATPEFFVCFDYFARKEWGEDYYKRLNDIVKPGPDLLELLNHSHYWSTNVEELESHDFGNEYDNQLRDNIINKIKSSRISEDDLKQWEESAASEKYMPIKFADGTRTIGSMIHQYFQQVIYSINQPSAARGMQSAFVNFAYFDKYFFDGMFGHFYFPDETTACWKSLKHLQQNFMIWFNEERLRTVMTFPVESFALVYKDNHFLDAESANFVAAEYARGHSFFTYISDSVDSLSSCCRLKNKLQTKEFNFTNGNLGVQTGSKSVITLNLNRIIQDYFRSAGIFDKEGATKLWQSEDSHEICVNNFKTYLAEILERVYKYHIAYNESLWDMFDAGLLPVYNAGFINLNKQYLTIGINGLNEAAEFVGCTITDNPIYQDFCQMMFGTIKENNTAHNGKFNGHTLMFNTECVPAESLAAKNYNWDKADGYWVPEDRNLYTSYVFLPSSTSTNIFEKIRMHGSRYIGDFLDGGSAAHLNMDSHLSESQYRAVLEYAAREGCQYFTFNIPNSECPECGFITKVPIEKCPKCGCDHMWHYDRIIGYLTRIDKWAEPRQVEQKTRVYEHVTDDTKVDDN